MTNKPYYFMESPDERERLERKTKTDFAQKQLQWAGLKRNMKALEVGCGTGAVTRVISEMSEGSLVVGVDASLDRVIDGKQLAYDSSIAAKFVQGNALRLPFDSGSFDFSWSRFLFEYLSEPIKALKEMIRVTKPGGIVAVSDLDGQIEQFYPLSEWSATNLKKALEILAQTGFDIKIGRKLYNWFFHAELQEIKVEVAPYQAYAGGIPDDQWHNWETKIRTSVQALTQLTGEEEHWKKVGETVLNEIRRKDVFYYCDIITVSGRVL